jgi:transposase
MPQARTLSIGMDVQKDAMAVASVAQAHHAEVRYLDAIGTRPGASDQLIRTMQSTSTQLVFVSDAGPCGSWLSRSLTKQGHGCWGVAPSLLPTKAGERVQTHRRAALQVARLMRSGDLTPVSVPQVAADALRDLRRARADARRALKTAQHRLNALLLRHALRSTGRAPWGPAPRRWRRAVVCPTPAPHLVFQEDIRAVTDHRERLGRLDQALQDQGQPWRLRPVVDALQALRGVQCTVAGTLVAALGDLARFDTPRQRRRSLGLTPSAYATGDQRHQGARTTPGHAHARRARLAGAGASRSPAKGNRPLQRRLAKRPKAIQDSRWQAQGRRCKRSRPVSARGKHAHRGVVAIARARRAFLGALAHQVPVPP